MTRNTLSEAEYQAFLDGELDPERRVEVCSWLARHPQEAARVFADLAVGDALNAALGRAAPARSRAPRRYAPAAIAAAAVAVWVVALLPFLHTLSHDDPGAQQTTFVETAVDARRNSRLRELIASQPESAAYDRGVLYATTGIPLPVLPADWSVRDVQVYPWMDGHSIGVLADSPDLGVVSLFAAPAGEAEDHGPAIARRDGFAIAHWQEGGRDYALVARAAPAAVAGVASDLSRGLATEDRSAVVGRGGPEDGRMASMNQGASYNVE
jgi:anti-sigma factor RsiW